MMACHRVACLRAALLLSLVGHAAASECPAGSGLCREVQEGAPASIGLVQRHAGKSQSAATQKLEAAGSSEQLPEAITNIIPEPLKNIFGDASAQGTVTALDTRLIDIDKNADSLLERCTAYQKDLFSTVSASLNSTNATADQRLEAGVAQLQTMVSSRLAPISSDWSLITSSLQTIGAPMVTTLRGLNLTTTATSVNQTFTSLMRAAKEISGLFVTVTSTVGKLSNATKEEQEYSLQELHVALDDGMTGVTGFKDSLVGFTTQIFAGLTTIVRDNSTIPPVQARMDSLAGKIEDSLDMALSGTHEAAHLVVRGLRGGAAPVGGAWLGLALAALCMGAGSAL